MSENFNSREAWDDFILHEEELDRERRGYKYCTWCCELYTGNIHICDCRECSAPYGCCTHHDYYAGYDKARLQ